MSTEVWGSASDVVWIDGEGELKARYVAVPENALAAVSEGFCPACAGVPLAGDPGNWCPSCEVCWGFRRAG